MPTATQPILKETDFRPLSSFRLKWRWTDARYNSLPSEDLATLRPLTKEKAREVWQYGRKFWGEMIGGGPLELSSSLFPSIIRADASGETEIIREWLAQHLPQNDSPVFVVWDSTDIVQVSCQTFCRYWDDFCYPSGDDNLIWPVSEEWALAYWHEEEFVFGTTERHAALESVGVIGVIG